MAITAPPPCSSPQAVLAHHLLLNVFLTVLVVAFAIALSVPEKPARAALFQALQAAWEQGLACAFVFEKGKEPFWVAPPSRRPVLFFFIPPPFSPNVNPRYHHENLA